MEQKKFKQVHEAMADIRSHIESKRSGIDRYVTKKQEAELMQLAAAAFHSVMDKAENLPGLQPLHADFAVAVLAIHLGEIAIDYYFCECNIRRISANRVFILG